MAWTMSQCERQFVNDLSERIGAFMDVAPAPETVVRALATSTALVLAGLPSTAVEAYVVALTTTTAALRRHRAAAGA